MPTLAQHVDSAGFPGVRIIQQWRADIIRPYIAYRNYRPITIMEFRDTLVCRCRGG